MPQFPRSIFYWFFVVLVAAGAFFFGHYTQVLGSVVVASDNNHAEQIISIADNRGAVETNQFRALGDGRLNILLLGIGGVDDMGRAHDGTLLTDSIQVLSFDTLNKKIGMTSVPRDLSINVPGYGVSKINAVYAHAEARQKGSGGPLARAVIGKVLGISISNYVVIDFTAAQEAVDAVGGVDITVPKTLYDPTYPAADQIHYDPLFITAGSHHMDGTLALKYMRTRHVDLDFGRSGRQQQVFIALKAKMLSLGVLSNPVTLSRLLSTIGQHIRTDLQPDQIQKLVPIFKDVPSQDIASFVLDESAPDSLLVGKMDPYLGDILYPSAGLTDYDQIHTWFQKNNPDPMLAKEGATVVVTSNGASVRDTNKFVDQLVANGFAASLDSVSSAVPSGSTPHANEFLMKSAKAHPITKQYLTTLLGFQPMVDASITSDFAIRLAKVKAPPMPLSMPSTKTITPKDSFPTPLPTETPSTATDGTTARHQP